MQKPKLLTKMEKSLIDAVDTFLHGRFKTCRSLLEGIPVEESRKSSLAQWLIENNLIVCTCKEQLVSGDHVPNVSRMIDRFSTIKNMMHGLPPSMKTLPVEMVVSFNKSALLLQKMISRDPLQSGLNQIDHAAADPVCTSLDQIKNIARTNFHRVCSAMGITEFRSAHLDEQLGKLTGISHLLPADVISLVLLQCCVLSLCHMISRQHQHALSILDMALQVHSGRVQDDRRKSSSLALIISLQMGNFDVSVNSLQDDRLSSLDAGHLTRFLLVVCLFQTGQWEDCLHQINIKQPKLPESLNLIQRFIQGFCLYRKGNFKSAQEHLTAITASPDCDVTLKVKTLNLIGCCLASLNKPYTAIQTFQEVLKVEFSYLCPLYNVSLVYRYLRLPDAELEALDLLLKSLKEKQSRRAPPPRNDDIILGPLATMASLEEDGYGIDEEALSVTFVMYTLAWRCLELGRHKDAIKRYQDLLKLIEADSSLITKSPSSRLKCSTGLPSIRTIYLETALSLYYADDIEQSLSTVDRILTKMAANGETKFETASRETINDGGNRRQNTSSELGEDALPGVSSHGNNHQGDREQDAVPSCSGTYTNKFAANEKSDSTPKLESGTSFRSSCIGTKKITSRCEEKVQEKLFMANTHLLKSNCLIKTNNLSHALRVTDELLRYLSGITRVEDGSNDVGWCTREKPLEMEEMESMEAGDAPRSKRRKIEQTSVIENTAGTSADKPEKRQQPISNSLLQIKAKAYNNKALILIGQKKNSEALQMLVLSMQCTPDDIDALYNYALLLTKMGRKKEACHTMKKLLPLEASLKRSPLSRYLLQT